MENKDIHNGLSEKEVRDYLSKQYQKEGYKCNWNPDVKFLEKELERHKKMLEAANIFNGIKALIKLQGWKTFDVFDEISDYEDDEDIYFEFMGTEEEFKVFIEKLKKENTYGEP